MPAIKEQAMLQPQTFLVLLSCLILPVQAVADSMADFLRLVEGEFISTPGSADDSLMRDRRAVVHAHAIGEHTVYLQINTGEDRKVYRQRLLTFLADPVTGQIGQKAWTFNEPERFVDAFDRPDVFRALLPDDLRPTLPQAGCQQVWMRQGEGWYGRVDPETCRIWSERRQAWRRIGAEAKLLPDRLMQAERGFDDQGNQVFGTEPGEFHILDRQD